MIVPIFGGAFTVNLKEEQLINAVDRKAKSFQDAGQQAGLTNKHINSPALKNLFQAMVQKGKGTSDIAPLSEFVKNSNE